MRRSEQFQRPRQSRNRGRGRVHRRVGRPWRQGRAHLQPCPRGRRDKGRAVRDSTVGGATGAESDGSSSEDAYEEVLTSGQVFVQPPSPKLLFAAAVTGQREEVKAALAMNGDGTIVERSVPDLAPCGRVRTLWERLEQSTFSVMINEYTIEQFGARGILTAAHLVNPPNGIGGAGGREMTKYGKTTPKRPRERPGPDGVVCRRRCGPCPAIRNVPYVWPAVPHGDGPDGAA